MNDNKIKSVIGTEERFLVDRNIVNAMRTFTPPDTHHAIINSIAIRNSNLILSEGIAHGPISVDLYYGDGDDWIFFRNFTIRF